MKNRLHGQMCWSTALWVTSHQLDDWSGNVLKGYGAAHRITGRDWEPGSDALDHNPKHHHGICMAVPTITTLTAACCHGLQCNFPLSPGASDFTTATKRVTAFCSNSKTNACDWLSQSHTLPEGWFQGNLESKHLLFSSSLGKLILILIKTHKAQISLHQI